MIYEKLNELNQYYERKRFKKEEIESLYSLTLLELFDHIGKNFIEWTVPYNTPLEIKHPPKYSFYHNGKLDPIHNILGKHLNSNKKNKAAIIWRGSDYTERIFTYQSLHFEMLKFAYALKNLGVKKEDRVLIYLPNVPETVISMLACVRIGAVHAMYHYTYSADSLAERINDCQPTIIITTDYSLAGTEINIKAKVDEALKKASHQPKHVIVVERIPKKTHMKPIRDLWYHDLLSDTDFTSASSLDPMIYDSNDPLFIMVTSTNFPEPKGLVFNVAGFLAWANYTYTLLFDLDDNDTVWNTSDISWMSGHTYGVYGPLLAGSTTVIFEDSITFENAKRFYGIIERYKINKCYTTPRIMKTLMNADMKKKVHTQLRSLEFLYLGGEPIEEDVLDWTYKKIVYKSAPILNVYSLTELGGAVAAQIVGYSQIKRDSVGVELPGVDLGIYDSITKTKINYENLKGLIMLETPLPSMCTKLCHEEDLYYKTFWKKYDNKYVFRIGDSGFFDKDKNLYLTGRVDNVIHVSGKRVNLAQVEQAINKNRFVKESALIILNDEKRGDSMVAFCVLHKKVDESLHKRIMNEIHETILEELGEVVLPQEIRFVRVLPKGADGSILRDLLKEIAMQM
ncbi:MAG: AMP-binding protein [Calditerrivibrio sp.]|nr:AMP-binding protein [Calditerrivibrio sp.]